MPVSNWEEGGFPDGILARESLQAAIQSTYNKGAIVEITVAAVDGMKNYDSTRARAWKAMKADDVDDDQRWRTNALAQPGTVLRRNCGSAADAALYITAQSQEMNAILLAPEVIWRALKAWSVKHESRKYKARREPKASPTPSL